MGDDEHFIVSLKSLATKFYNFSLVPVTNNSYCIGIWFKSSFIEYTPWISMPCSIKYKVNDVICETTRPQTLANSSYNVKMWSKGTGVDYTGIFHARQNRYMNEESDWNNRQRSKYINHSTFLKMQDIKSGRDATQFSYTALSYEQVCEQWWTFIHGFCYRLLKWNALPKVEEECTLDHPNDTIVSHSDFIKRHLFAFLEYTRKYEIQCSNFKAVRIRIKNTCYHFEYVAQSNMARWTTQHDCLISKRLSLSLKAMPLNVNNECSPGEFPPYFIDKYCYTISKSSSLSKLIVPLYLDESGIDNMKLQLASYLAKSDKEIQLGNILIQLHRRENIIGDGLVYHSVESGELVMWNATKMNASSASHVLCKKRMVRMKQPISCHDREFRCDDGTCILQHHQCDGEADCPDQSDEASCHATSLITCFTACHPPHCVCGFMYIQCHEGRCVLLSKLCDGVPHCSEGYDEQNCTNDELISYNNIFQSDSSMVNQVNNHGDIGLVSTDNACKYTRELYTEGEYLFNAPHLIFCYHRRCPGMCKCYRSYCIPFQYVCDTIPDCPSGEEELQCRTLVCVGLLKCKSDQVCLSRDGVCDGWKHCMMSWDDEMQWSLGKCPMGCLCIGLTMECVSAKHITIPEYDTMTKAIDIGNNLIRSPKTLSYFPYMRRLNLSKNVIDVLTETLFINLQHLSLLDLSSNFIDAVMSRAFIGLQKLTIINSDENCIITLHSFGFYGLRFMNTLFLNNQQFRDVRKYCFYGLSSLYD